MDKEQILYQGRNRDWIFGFKYKDCEKGAIFTLMKLADIPIRRHVKVKCEANPYDPTWDAYFLKRMQKRNRSRTSRKGTYRKQLPVKARMSRFNFMRIKF